LAPAQITPIAFSRRKANQSILDWITGEVAGLKRELGASDRERLDKYVTDIR